MSCFLYPSTPSTLHVPNPRPSPDLIAAVERDYLGIGLACFSDGLSTEKSLSPASPLTSSSSSSSSSEAAATAAAAINSQQQIASILRSPPPLGGDEHDDLCGSHLKLAPPCSSADDGVANDDEQAMSGNVGWPPISSYRKATTRSLSTKNSCYTSDTMEASHPILLIPQGPFIGIGDQIKDCEDDALQNDIQIDDSSIYPCNVKKQRKSAHIKVSMDGTPIMRKLDLESMQGYQHLSLELHKLFKFYKRNLSCEVGVSSSLKDCHIANFILTYKDRDGDWMLVGDTPWKTFAYSAKRIRIMKKAD